MSKDKEQAKKALQRIKNSRPKINMMHFAPCEDYNCPCNELFDRDILLIQKVIEDMK